MPNGTAYVSPNKVVAVLRLQMSTSTRGTNSQASKAVRLARCEWLSSAAPLM